MNCVHHRQRSIYLEKVKILKVTHRRPQPFTVRANYTDVFDDGTRTVWGFSTLRTLCGVGSSEKMSPQISHHFHTRVTWRPQLYII